MGLILLSRCLFSHRLPGYGKYDGPEYKYCIGAEYATDPGTDYLPFVIDIDIENETIEEIGEYDHPEQYPGIGNDAGQVIGLQGDETAEQDLCLVVANRK